MNPASYYLDQKLRAAGIPIDGVDSTGTVTYHGATQAQRDQGAAIVASFDSSPTALATLQAQFEKEAASAALDTPANNDRLIRALALVVLDEINILRARFTNPALTPRTAAQVIAAIKAKL